MQFIAMITMLIDHVGATFFPDQLEWRIIGRIAFPIYAYCIVVGYRHTKNVKKYLIRLMIIAIVSQYPYMLVFGTWGLNTVASLLVALMVLVALDRYKGFFQVFIIVGIAGLLLEAFDFSYGMYGLFLVLAYRYASKHGLVAIHLILNLVFMGSSIGTLNIVATILIVYFPLFYVYVDKMRIPRWLWRSFYPAHLAIIALILLIK